ncbi:hypothetical protein CLAIMM_00794 isoform 1 [Cladophialophora immunda]|nr:hypothetical protein CLAIMM_00794 isoform 1 [Cladophialophora immunda]
MPVFSAPYVGLPDPEKRTVESMEPPMTQITSPERRNKSWYKKLSLSSRSIGRSDRSSRTSTGLLESQARSEQEYLLLNKPLPPLPQPPYFEYMFADAGLKAMMSNESMRSTFEAHGNAQATIQRDTNHVQITIPSPSNGGFILDTPDIAQFAFAQAGVDVTTKDVIDSHFAALGTGLEGHLHIDMNEELEKERATESFFGGVEAREGPSPDHIPVVDEDGFADRREGLEDWPQLWAPDKETLADYEIPGSENFSAQLGKTPNHDDNDSDKPILQPKSQKNKVKAALQDPSLPDSFYAADGTITDPAVQPVQRPRPLTIRKRGESMELLSDLKILRHSPVKKRNARDSFVTRSTGNEPKPDGECPRRLSFLESMCLPSLTRVQTATFIFSPRRRSAWQRSWLIKTPTAAASSQCVAPSRTTDRPPFPTTTETATAPAPSSPMSTMTTRTPLWLSNASASPPN